jgi:DnaK suppressor protein
MSRKNSLSEMKEILLQRRDALRQAIAGDDSLLQEMSLRSGGDEVDFALESAHGEISSQLAEVGSRELAYVENALKQFEENTYGKCEACRNNIPLARLQALPYATFCINCKLKAEKAGIEPGTVVDWSVILDGNTDDLRMNDFNIS